MNIIMGRPRLSLPLSVALLLLYYCESIAADQDSNFISASQVVIVKDSKFVPPQTVLNCAVKGGHDYCIWTTPSNEECRVQGNCAHLGIAIKDNVTLCSVSIQHSRQNSQLITGKWHCKLAKFHDNLTVDMAHNDTAFVFVVDTDQSPSLEQIGTDQQLSFPANDSQAKVEFQCITHSLAPRNVFTWFISGYDSEMVQQSFNAPGFFTQGQGQIATSITDSQHLVIRRDHFGHSVGCTVTKQDSNGVTLVNQTVFHSLDIIMDPVVKSFNATYQGVQVDIESYPPVTYGRLSPDLYNETHSSDQCGNDCVIFECPTNKTNKKCIMNVAPYSKAIEYYYTDISLTRLSDACSKLAVAYKLDNMGHMNGLNIEIGNAKTMAEVVVALPHHHNRNDSMNRAYVSGGLKDSTVVTAVTVTTISALVMCMLAVLVIKYRQPLSEWFKYGEYFVVDENNGNKTGETQL